MSLGELVAVVAGTAAVALILAASTLPGLWGP
jgi:hypothetical protein